MTTTNSPVQLATIPTPTTLTSVGDAHDAYERIIYLNSTEAFREADRLLGEGWGVKEVTSAHVTLTFGRKPATQHGWDHV